MKPNVRLLQKVKAAILAGPEQFDMNCWGWEKGGCGTPACIAGWACKIAEPEVGMKSDVKGRAERLLRLGEFDFCYTSHWPKRLRLRYHKCKTPRGRARVAADFIEYLCGKKNEKGAPASCGSH